MPVYSHEVFIARPIDAVFAAVADVNTHPKWQAGLVETHGKAVPPRVGERGTEVRRMLGRRMEFPYEITHFEPPHRWGFRALRGPIRPAAVLTFRANGSGTMVRSEFQIPGLPGWLLGPILLRQQKRNYQELKSLLKAERL
ncbi:MAG TPA: SRPBCC family protein [Bryobacteraceae bacterium]|nr:SRPBCC family protein [Bryobacteraceae bacterium]